MSDQLHYQSLEELRALPLEALQALWEIVPTDRQRAYKTSYEREVRNAGAAGSDASEVQVNAELMRRYEEAALVPIGMRWARTPTRVQLAARQSDAVGISDDFDANRAGKLPSRVIIGTGLIALLLVGLMFTRMISGSSRDTATTTPQVSQTPTPRISPTPTPLALEAQDDVIEGGDAARAVAYPVNLQVITDDDTNPRVWVVQRRAIRASEWNFDPNPDTASFINGMSVRPVIGIPWSEDNEAFFDDIADGSRFLLTMNTGAILRFDFDTRTEVRRSDTGIFRQVSPGLVLLLIGETDLEGFPSAARTLVTAVYSPEQELSRDGLFLGATISLQEGEIGDTLSIGDTQITLQNAERLVNQPDLTSEQQFVSLTFDVTAGSELIVTSDWQMQFTDLAGQTFPQANILTGLPPQLEPSSQGQFVVSYLAPASLSAARWSISDRDGNGVWFNISLLTPEIEGDFQDIDVQLVSVTYIENQITTTLRIFNGQRETLQLTPNDIWLSLGYTPEPIGPRTPAEGLASFDLLPEQAADIRLIWAWDNEPYASLGIGAYRYSIQFTRT